MLNKIVNVICRHDLSETYIWIIVSAPPAPAYPPSLNIFPKSSHFQKLTYVFHLGT